MNLYNIIGLIAFLAILTLSGFFLGNYIFRVFADEPTFMTPILRPCENFLYKVFGINKTDEMTANQYVFTSVIFNIIGIIFLFLLQSFQKYLPLNPEHLPNVRIDTAINTAISFVTNTNWQSYSGETTMSYLTQMLGLTVQNFVSAATGIAAFFAFIRGFGDKTINTIGNFWIDLTKILIYVLLPLSIIIAIALVSQGVIQNLSAYIQATTMEGIKQILPQGPVASQIAIKHLGTNGGGFFGGNSGHPFENPTLISNLVEIFAILLIPVSLPFMLGRFLKKIKIGKIIFFTMGILFIIGLIGVLYFELRGNPVLAKIGINNGLNLEGKNVLFGISGSAFFAQATTATSCGAINSLHDCYMPLSGLILLFNMMTGEIIFGGVGTGIAVMILYMIITMFIVGLMIGRTPELFGKKLEPKDVVLTLIAISIPSIIQLILGAIAISTTAGLSSLGNSSFHGISEILYAYASALGNNGSAFSGLNSDTAFYNITTAIGMFVGRFTVIIPIIYIGSFLAKKKTIPVDARFPLNYTFIAVIIFTIFVLGALTFFPVLVSGPILEYLHLIKF